MARILSLPPPGTEWHGPPIPSQANDIQAVLASVIARGGRLGNCVINMRNLQSDVSCTAPPRLPSLHLSITTPNFSNEDNEIFGTWIWRSSCMVKLSSVNNTDGAS